MKSSPKREKNQVLLPYESHVITSLRVRHGLWQALKLKCIAEGLTLSDEVERLIDRYVEPEYISLIKKRMILWLVLSCDFPHTRFMQDTLIVEGEVVEPGFALVWPDGTAFGWAPTLREAEIEAKWQARIYGRDLRVVKDTEAIWPRVRDPRHRPRRVSGVAVMDARYEKVDKLYRSIIRRYTRGMSGYVPQVVLNCAQYGGTHKMARTNASARQ